MARKRVAAAEAPARPSPAARHDMLAGEVLRQFRQVFNAVKTHFQQVEKAVGLGGAQVWALSVVRDRPGLRVTELAQAMDIHQTTASNLVKALVERDLIAAARGGADRRVVQLRLRPAGARALRAVPGPFEGVLPGALRTLDTALLKRLDVDLRALLAALGTQGRGAQVPLAEL